MRRRLPNGWQKGSCSASAGQGSHSPNGLQTNVGWGSYVVVGDSCAATSRRQNDKNINGMNLTMEVRGNTESVDPDDFELGSNRNMSRRTAAIEEFDDDTDLPLPSRPLLGTGSRTAILEEISTSDDQDSSVEDDDDNDGGTAPGPGSSFRSAPSTISDALPSNTITDITPYKHWACIYPIYIDAKRPYGNGERRIAREKSVWWPLSKDIADATNRLGLGTIHEVNKVHPRDWENPGRVRVQWKKDGRLINNAIGTKRQLLEMISLQIQRIKPDNIPRPPYTVSALQPTTLAAPVAKAPTSNKGKQPVKSKTGTAAALQPQKPKSQRSPVPPEPHPPLASRLPAYSPALPTGVLIETVKAGMNAPDQGAGLGPGMAGGSMQKGKRKVIRMRG